MWKCITTTGVTVLAVAALHSAGTAAAAPTGASSAADVVNSLQGQGYSVQINGSRTAPLSDCIVTGIHGVPNSDGAGRLSDPTQFTTVFVDVSCPPTNN